MWRQSECGLWTLEVLHPTTIHSQSMLSFNDTKTPPKKTHNSFNKPQNLLNSVTPGCRQYDTEMSGKHFFSASKKTLHTSTFKFRVARVSEAWKLDGFMKIFSGHYRFCPAEQCPEICWRYSQLGSSSSKCSDGSLGRLNASDHQMLKGVFSRHQ